MATERLSMRKTREILRQKLLLGRSHREVADSLGVSAGGEKAFVDYSGKKPHIVDPKTGECIDVELFVAALGASNYTYSEATLTQSGPDWIASHVRTLRFFGGVPGALVPDQLKSGVTK